MQFRTAGFLGGDRAERRAAAVVLAVTALAYGAFSAYAILNARTWTDEVTYLVKSWWYVTGQVAPYSDQDATWYMPLFFYQLGWVQKLFGTGLVAGRAMSAVIGGASGVLVFLICRRLTGNAVIGAVAVAIYLLTPSTAYYFAAAAPLATVAFLTLLAVWLVAISAGRPRAWISAALGLLFCILFFYRQNMILAVALLAPAYIVAISHRRAMHAGIVAAAGAAGVGVMLAVFPAKLGLYALWLPVVTPILGRLHLLAHNFRLILEGTDSAPLLDPGLSSLAGLDLVIAFVLPYLGTILLAAGLFFVTARAQRRLLVFPVSFFLLAGSHYFGSAGYCKTCILMYTNYFAGIGVIAAALTLAAIWRMSAVRSGPACGRVLLAGVCAIGLNALASGIPVPYGAAGQNPYRFFPEPMLHQFGPIPERLEIDAFAKIIAATTPADKPILVLHNQPSLPYAVARAGRRMAVQSLNIRQSYRGLRDGLSAQERAEVIGALEAESLWTDESLRNWLENGFDTVIYEAGTGHPAFPPETVLAQHFDLRTQAEYLGWTIRIYVRRPAGAG